MKLKYLECSRYGNLSFKKHEHKVSKIKYLYFIRIYFEEALKKLKDVDRNLEYNFFFLF